MPRRRRWLLAISLLVNVFAVGALGGGLFVLARPGLWPAAARPSARPIRAAGDDLPAPGRTQFRLTMRQALEANADLVRQAQAARRLAGQLFIQPQFDQAAVSAALERARQADITLRTRLETAAVGFAATLPQGDRALLAQGLERGGPLRRPPPNAQGSGLPP